MPLFSGSPTEYVTLDIVASIPYLIIRHRVGDLGTATTCIASDEIIARITAKEKQHQQRQRLGVATIEYIKAGYGRSLSNTVLHLAIIKVCDLVTMKSPLDACPNDKFE